MEFIKINRIIGVDVDVFLGSVVNFVENRYAHVVDYYQGKALLNHTVFDELDKLLRIANIILTSFKINKTAFVNLWEWEILDIVEEANVKLQTMAKTSKYLRSSIMLATYNNGLQNEDYMLKQNQTLEGVSWSELKSNDPNNDWVDVAVQNDLREEEYTTSGLINLKVNYVKTGTVNDIKVVVDNIYGENILGADIQQLLVFDIVEEDLIVLNNEDTVLQSAEILLNLSKNDNPEYWRDGIASNLLGNSIASFAYPILFRQLSQVFGTDDTFSTFQLGNLSVEKDGMKMQINIETILGEMVKKELAL